MLRESTGYLIAVQNAEKTYATRFILELVTEQRT